jgi:hypothetical protein
MPRGSWYSGDVKPGWQLSSCVALVCAGLLGCTGTQSGETARPPIANAPDDFVLRDVRKDAATRMGCQAPMVDVRLGEWAGSEGNVVAIGCGYRITYYLRCLTNHQCSVTITD